MDETWVVHETAPDELIAWLGDLAADARRVQAQNPARSQVKVLDAAALDVENLPLPVRSRAMHAGAIYARTPARGEPLGRLLVLALIEPVEAGVLRVEIAGDPSFPLQSEEVRRHFRHRFPRHARGAGGRRTGLLLKINRESESDHTGAPVLACNVWLEEQLAQLQDPADQRKLFRPWLERYRALRGVDPADPARSFRAAVAGCQRRLRRRGVPHKSAHDKAGHDKAGHDKSAHDKAVHDKAAHDKAGHDKARNPAQPTAQASAEGAQGAVDRGQAAAGSPLAGNPPHRQLR